MRGRLKYELSGRICRGEDMDKFDVSMVGLVLLCIFFVPIFNIVAVEGVEVTVTGSIQLVILDHSKLFGYDYTKIEMLTYSGDTHHLELLGHVTDLEYGKTYRVTYVRVPVAMHYIIKGRVTNIVELDG